MEMKLAVLTAACASVAILLGCGSGGTDGTSTSLSARAELGAAEAEFIRFLGAEQSHVRRELGSIEEVEVPRSTRPELEDLIGSLHRELRDLKKEVVAVRSRDPATLKVAEVTVEQDSEQVESKASLLARVVHLRQAQLKR
jgi:hypothetical protein